MYNGLEKKNMCLIDIPLESSLTASKFNFARSLLTNINVKGHNKID